MRKLFLTTMVLSTMTLSGCLGRGVLDSTRESHFLDGSIQYKLDNGVFEIVEQARTLMEQVRNDPIREDVDILSIHTAFDLNGDFRITKDEARMGYDRILRKYVRALPPPHFPPPETTQAPETLPELQESSPHQ